jgi:hypothetical protein
MLADKTGLREKGSLVAPAPINAAPVGKEREERKQSELSNIAKMLNQGLIDQNEAADMIRKTLEKYG